MEDITIDLEKIAKMPDNSITDAETIRQLAVHSIQTNDTELLCKIKKEFEYLGLYPHVMKPINMDYTKYTPDDLVMRASLLKDVIKLRELRMNEKKNSDGSYMKYQHASTPDVIKYLDMVKELKNFAVRNQDYEGAGALRNMEKLFMETLHEQ